MREDERGWLNSIKNIECRSADKNGTIIQNMHTSYILTRPHVIKSVKYENKKVIYANVQSKATHVSIVSN